MGNRNNRCLTDCPDSSSLRIPGRASQLRFHCTLSPLAIMSIRKREFHNYQYRDRLCQRHYSSTGHFLTSLSLMSFAPIMKANSPTSGLSALDAIKLHRLVSTAFIRTWPEDFERGQRVHSTLCKVVLCLRLRQQPAINRQWNSYESQNEKLFRFKMKRGYTSCTFIHCTHADLKPETDYSCRLIPSYLMQGTAVTI